MTAVTPALFDWCPNLVDRLPRVPIVAGPTSVQRLVGLERRLDSGPLWVKRDDLTARPLGGNKPRKLEFLLGEARARGARTLITFGGLGSNHALATAVYGRERGFAVVTILVPQPVDDHVRWNLTALRKQGARLVFVGGNVRAGLAAAGVGLLASVREGRLPYVIPPGGSSPVGSLGYVSAALELSRQVKQESLPPPAAVFVASGSNGTTAGLLVGFRLAGLPTRVVAVRVSDRLRVNAGAIAGLANATVRLLRRQGAPVAGPALAPSDVDVWDGYLGPGYGRSTPVGERAIRLFAEADGLRLERTYTGKTAAAFIDAATRPEWRGRPLLFWQTGDPAATAALAGEEVDGDEWPGPARDLAA